MSYKSDMMTKRQDENDHLSKPKAPYSLPTELNLGAQRSIIIYACEILNYVIYNSKNNQMAAPHALDVISLYL